MLGRVKGFLIYIFISVLILKAHENKNRPYLQYIAADHDFIEMHVTFFNHIFTDRFENSEPLL